MSSVVIDCVDPQWILYIIYSKHQRQVANLVCVQRATRINTHLREEQQDTGEKRKEEGNKDRKVGLWNKRKHPCSLRRG